MHRPIVAVKKKRLKIGKPLKKHERHEEANKKQTNKRKNAKQANQVTT